VDGVLSLEPAPDPPDREYVMTEPPTLIAEIGCNHMGDVGLAKEFIDVAATFCKVTHVKFQKRHIPSVLSPEQYAAPHPDPQHAFRDTYGEHREFLELDVEQHRELQEYCRKWDLTYSASVWDVLSFREIASLEPPYLKIPSAANNDPELLQVAAKEYDGQVHVSLGMTTRAEEEQILDVFSRAGRLHELVLYACTSGYPIQPEEAYLLEIPRLLADYGSDVAAIGYSGHHRGISLDVAAFTLGAHFIERHFTLDRTWKGTDHAASLEPDGLRRLQRDLRNAALAIAPRPAEVVPVEEAQRAKLKWHREVRSSQS
jgi:N-acetylneuraminate synthase